MSGSARAGEWRRGCSAAALGASGAALAVQTFIGDEPLLLAWVHTFGGFLWLPVAIAAGIAVFSRSRLRVAFAAVWVLWSAYLIVPSPREAPVDGAPFSVVSGNLFAGNPTLDLEIAELLAEDADVIVLQEFTPAAAAALRALGGLERYPHFAERPAMDCFGAAIYAKYPLREVAYEPFGAASGVRMLRAIVSAPGGDVEVWNVHTLPPIDARYHEIWLEQIVSLAARVADARGPLVVAGDLNLTPHHAGYRRVTAELRDAFVACGEAGAHTWPQGLFGLPPMVRLDHVLLKGDVGCASLAVGDGAGSDHRPVRVDLAVADPRRASR